MFKYSDNSNAQLPGLPSLSSGYVLPQPSLNNVPQLHAPQINIPHPHVNIPSASVNIPQISATLPKISVPHISVNAPHIEPPSFPQLPNINAQIPNMPSLNTNINVVLCFLLVSLVHRRHYTFLSFPTGTPFVQGSSK